MVAWLAPVLTIGASLYSGYRSSQNARNAANTANEATERQFEYDTQKWEMSKDKLLADREYAIQQIMNNAANERNIIESYLLLFFICLYYYIYIITIEF